MTGRREGCTLQELAEYIGGRVVGDPRLEIKGIQSFEKAEAGDLTLALEKRYRNQITATRASAVIASADFSSTQKSVLQVKNPKLAFARLLAFFHEKAFAAEGISPLAQVGRGCHISDEVTIGPFVYVGDKVKIGDRVTLFPGVYVGDGCVIGQDCTLHPNVVLYENVSLGRRVILHGGTVIGADGYGYVFDGKRHVKILQTGTVVIKDDVEIGANSCVDRATLGTTVIEKGVKLDNHVHIGHNCKIGENTLIVAQVGLAGSVETGKDCAFGGQAGVIDQIRIGDRVRVMVKSAVTKDIDSDQTISGNPAMDHRRWMRLKALSRRLPELYERQKVIGGVPSIRRRKEKKQRSRSTGKGGS